MSKALVSIPTPLSSGANTATSAASKRLVKATETVTPPCTDTSTSQASEEVFVPAKRTPRPNDNKGGGRGKNQSSKEVSITEESGDGTSASYTRHITRGSKRAVEHGKKTQESSSTAAKRKRGSVSDKAEGEVQLVDGRVGIIKRIKFVYLFIPSPF